MPPDEWGAANRIYPSSSGVPGKRDPGLTPYMIPFGRGVADGVHPKVVLCCASQVGKTETFLDIIGERMDNAPAPLLYVGPNLKFLNEQFEPRLMALFDQAEALGMKVQKGKKMTKTRKIVSGVSIRLAHSNSSTALKSDSIALALTDEADELVASVRGQGDPIGLTDRRGEAYADFVHAIVSTPSKGPSLVKRDPDTGLEFWAEQDPDDLDSKIWLLWQNGTRYHWAWPCPHCGEYFIPRFACLDPGEDWRKLSPEEARSRTRMICPKNGCVIGDADPEKTAIIAGKMNDRGVYVAPGQKVSKRGVVSGDPPISTTLSYWVSGLCSPFTSWNERAQDYVEALRSGDQNEVQTVVNGGFGEMWTPTGGDIPEWEEVRKLKLATYQEGHVPRGVRFLTMGVDVQKNRLVFAIRGWGRRQESWLIKAGELWGDTSLDDVWSDLATMMESPYDRRMIISRVFVDAGFRPGKKDDVPEHKVYEFGRRFSRLVRCTKGFEHRPTPLTVNRIDVRPSGKKPKFGLDLVRLDSDFFKSWVHERLRWPPDQPGGWHLYDGITEAYCRQIVSEARVKKAGGGYTWLARSRDNHFLDAEALAYAAAYMLGVHHLEAPQRRKAEPRSERNEAPPAPPEALAATAARGQPVPRPAPRAAPKRVHTSSYL